MKFKPTRKAGGLLVELGPGEAQLPLHAEAKGVAVPRFTLDNILVPVDFSACPVLVVRENEREFLAREPISVNDRKAEPIYDRENSCGR